MRPCARRCSEAVLLELPAPVTFDMVQTREDMLIGGQRIARYKIEAFVDGAWKVRKTPSWPRSWANSRLL